MTAWDDKEDIGGDKRKGWKGQERKGLTTMTFPVFQFQMTSPGPSPQKKKPTTSSATWTNAFSTGKLVLWVRTV